MQDPKINKNGPSGHHRTTLSGYIFASKARINRKKIQLVRFLSKTLPVFYNPDVHRNEM